MAAFCQKFTRVDSNTDFWNTEIRKLSVKDENFFLFSRLETCRALQWLGLARVLGLHTRVLLHFEQKVAPFPAKLTYGVEVLVPRVSSWEVGLWMVCPHQWVLLMMEHLGCGEIWGWSLARDTGEWDLETLPWGPGKPFSTGCVRVCQTGFQKPPPRLPVLILRTERAEAP